MAEAVVSFVVEKIDQLLIAEANLLCGVSGEVGDIKNELESIRAFLRNANAREEMDDEVKVWVRQVREVAYNVEDVIDEFELLLARRPHRRGFVGFLHKLSHSFKHLKAMHRIAKQIENIKKDVSGASKRRNDYHFNSSEQSSSSSNVTHMRWRDPRGDALLIEETELVGIDKRINELIERLVDEGLRLRVISVVGSGGLGKTTLVRKVYDRDAVKKHFQHWVWITVSQTPQIEQILTDVLVQLNQQLPQVQDSMNKVAQLQKSLKEYLQYARYVVVFDDIWDEQVWNAVKYAFPDNNCGSRIIVTTRSTYIASFCVESDAHVYNLEPLQDGDALALFCKRACRSEIIPLDLKEISENLLRRCEGLPLAIVAISGLLSAKKMTDWQRVSSGLATELESTRELSDLKRILLLSYNDLPNYLKLCFLYVSVFPQDYFINCNKVIRLWIAEGFIKEREGRRKVEDVAEDYLKELIDRNLVQVVTVDIAGRVKEFRVHDLLREIIVSKFCEQHFAVLVNEQSTSRLPEKVRHLFIQSSDENLAEHKSFPHLRSLFMFRGKINPKVDYGFRLLRVLDLEGVPFEMFPRELVNAPLLKYLSLRNTMIKRLPNRIGKLQNLQTLDLKNTYVSELPIGILKIRHLRHLLVSRPWKINSSGGMSIEGFKAPAGIESLVALQKLYFLEANHSTVAIKELGRLKQLRRLGVTNLRKEDGIHLCSSIEKMSDLRSLVISSVRGEELDVRAPLFPPPPRLERLYMAGPLEMLPHWIPSLSRLVKLRLHSSRLRNDPLEALQDLPYLAELYLVKAYEGEHLCFRTRKFPRLKNLQLHGLDGLKSVSVEEGAMLHLQTLGIWSCKLLETVPLGIENLTNLRDLTLDDLSAELFWRVFKGGKDYWRIARIPVVYLP